MIPGAWRPIGSDNRGRQFASAHVELIAQAAEVFAPGGQGFGLFIAIEDGGVEIEAVAAFAEHAMNCGCAAVSIWGTDCERYHDIFDEVALAQSLATGRPGVLMTTWHAEESLQDALTFYILWACVDEEFAPPPNHWLILSIGNAAGAAVVDGLASLLLRN